MRRLWSLLALPLLSGAVALAADGPDPVPPAKPPADTSGPKAPPVAPPKAPESKIPWIHDYEEAKTKAAAEKRGLFVYLTPTWFT